ncbi:MAG: T9SS type A sorting domain-containing protein [Chitinophagales bacterium]
MLKKIAIYLFFLIASIQYTFAQLGNFYFPSIPIGALSNMECKDNKIDLYIKTNQQCDFDYDCHGLFNEQQHFETTAPFRNFYNFSINYTNSLIPDERRSDAIIYIQKFPVSNDSVLFQYTCYTDNDSSVHCRFADALPYIGSSYYDENNNVHYLGYLETGDCIGYTRNTSTLRYVKATSALKQTMYSSFPDSAYYPDSLLQFYDIEKHTFAFGNNDYYDYGTLILPTADKQQLILYTTAKEDTVRHSGIPGGINIIKLDSNLNRTYSQSLFSNYFDNDSSFLEIQNTQHTTYNNTIYIEAYAYRVLNGNLIGDTIYGLLLTCNSDGIVLNSQVFIGYAGHYFQNHIDSLNQLKQSHVDYKIFNTNSSCTVKYYNSQGIEIKSITFNQKLNHNLLKTIDNRYLFVSYDDTAYNGYTETKVNLNIYDSIGHFLKKVPLVLNIPYFDNSSFSYNPKAFLALDTFNNVILFFQQPNSVGGSGCSVAFQSICAGIQNLDYTNYVEGNILHDINNNCQSDSAETNAVNILVELLLNNRHYYTTTNYLGNFTFAPKDTGHGKVILHLENQNTFTYACEDTFDVYISDTTQNPIINFLVQTQNCVHATPKLKVEISTPFLRRCFDNNYTLTLFNESSDTALNSYVDIELDEHLIATDTAFTSAQNLGNNTYRLFVGDVAPLQTIRKNLKIKVDCDSTILGQTHCVKATSFPYETCLIADLPRINASAVCRNDTVFFYIQNSGSLNAFDFPYRILENDSVLTEGTIHFSSLQFFDAIAVYNPSGKTLRLEGRQFPIYPNEDNTVAVTIEGCGNPDFSMGYVNLFPQDDDAPNVDMDCHQNVGSFDPNEKTAQPDGLGDSSYILPNTPIEYTIHFQNKGTFASSYVTIIDTLSAVFDITTFQMLSSSHNFIYTIIDSNILQFTSININLPAEQDDTLGSNGYIKFKIAPKNNIAIGTVIKNTAAITFDFNAPIITNTVIRTLSNFLTLKIISSVKDNLSKIKSNVYPNPFNQTATLSFDYKYPTQLSILSIDGKIVQQYQSDNNFYTIDRNSLSNGLYLYELHNNETKELLDTGKLIVQ